MEITVSRQNSKKIFTVTGRLDTASAPELQALLIPAFDEAAHVELDFAGLSYVSSAGLRVLLLGEKTAKSKDAAMSLVNVSEEVKAIFDMTGFTDILKIV